MQTRVGMAATDRGLWGTGHGLGDAEVVGPVQQQPGGAPGAMRAQVCA